MKNKWSIISILVAVAVVLVGLYSISEQADQYEGIRATLFLHLGYCFTFSTAMLFIGLGVYLREKKG